MNRRDMVLGLGASALLTKSLTAEDKPDKKSQTIEYLFVQNAGTVLLKNGVLTLQKVNPATLYFSDRPNRVVGHVPTTKFVSLGARATTASRPIRQTRHCRLSVTRYRSSSLSN